MIYKLIWKYLSKGLIKYYLADTNKPVTHSKLEYAFTDMNGKKYYRFPNMMSLPIDRYTQLMKFTSLMQSRLTQDNITEITELMLKMIQEGIDKNKNASRVGALCYELQVRDKWIIPHQLIYDILCLQYVREDEAVDEFVIDIHLQKVSQFQSDISKNSFFLELPEWKQLTTSSRMSEVEWIEYCQRSMEQQGVRKEILKAISSKK